MSSSKKIKIKIAKKPNYDNLFRELKNKFGNRLWLRTDKDFYTTAKCQILKNPKWLCIIDCDGEYDDLDFHLNYSGDEEFNNIMKKYCYKASMEWEDSCLAVIYENNI